MQLLTQRNFVIQNSFISLYKHMASSSSSSSSSCHLHSAVLSIVLLLVQSMSVRGKITLPKGVVVPAVLVFGDSIVDPGNNNNLPTISKANFPPYGKDFRGGVPSGRFSNGKIPSDMAAEELGIKELIPAYLDPKLQPDDLLTGVSFASGGCGYDPISAQASVAVDLSGQIDLFKEYTGKVKAMVGEERTASIISNSLYLVVAGSNDISNTYFGSPFRKYKYDVPAYTDLMVQHAVAFVQELYDLGARRIAITGAPPIGCVPSQRTLAGGKQRACVDKFNQAAALFNSKLSNALDQFNTGQYPHLRVVYIDIFKPLLDLIFKPTSYGFEISDRGCCGTGLIEVIILCNKANPFTCTDDSKYVFWDSFHPTQKAYEALFIPILNSKISSFICGDGPC